MSKNGEHEHKPCPVCRVCLECHPHTRHETGLPGPRVPRLLNGGKKKPPRKPKRKDPEE